MLAIADYPQLKMLAWNRPGNPMIAERDALGLYEANWRFVEPDKMDERERRLLDQLVRQFGRGVLNV
jgi:hypothetical protein